MEGVPRNMRVTRRLEGRLLFVIQFAVFISQPIFINKILGIIIIK